MFIKNYLNKYQIDPMNSNLKRRRKTDNNVKTETIPKVKMEDDRN